MSSGVFSHPLPAAKQDPKEVLAMQEGVPRHSQASDQSSNAKAKQKQIQTLAHDRIVLCIGGRILETSKQTLCVDANSMLAAWVLRHLHHSSDGDKDYHRSKNDGHDNEDACKAGCRYGNDEGHILWIDRDAHRFDHVLNYLRNGTIWLEDVASLRAVQEEAVYFGLSGLETLCEERIQAVEALKRQHSEEFQESIRCAIADFCKNLLSCSSLPSNSSSNGEVLAILRARRLGASDASHEPIFQMNEDF